MTRLFLITLLFFSGWAVAGVASATSVFLSTETVPGGVVHNETAAVDISGGGNGTLGIWVVPEAAQRLDGIDLNLRIVETAGNAIDLTQATVANPTIAGSGGAKRWFDNGSFVGTGVDSVAADFIGGISGITTTTGAPGEGTGLADANQANDPLFDAGSGAYLFATIDYAIVDTNATADLFLQISDAGITDSSGLMTAIVFGLADPALDASVLGDRNTDSLTADGTTNPLLLGDFDLDDDVDGSDFLLWQRGGSPNPFSPNDLAAWQSSYGSSTPSTVANMLAVPEPSTLLLAFLAVTFTARQCRR